MRTPILLLITGGVAAAQEPTHPLPDTHEAEHDHAAAGVPDGFSPTIRLVIDALGDFTDSDGGDDGFDLRLRAFELSADAQVDPDTWAHVVVVADEDDVQLDEAVVDYSGLGDDSSVRAGRFFVDFGSQMQMHVHDLPYPNRPGVLTEYLGEELAGTGVQWESHLATGGETAVRYSIAVFDSLEDHDHGHEDEDGGAEQVVADRNDIDELSMTARLAASTGVGEAGRLRWGLSLRHVPEFTFELDSSGDEVDGRSNTVFGIDLAYGTTGGAGSSGTTVGLEYLVFDGDIGSEIDDAGTPGDETDDTIDVVDDDVHGLYVWAERAVDARDSFGILYSTFEHPEDEKPEDSEITAYYTRNLSDASRLRFAVSLLDSDERGDEVAVLVQFTNFVGHHPHEHGGAH